ncbi:MAG: PDC sensor domain-containing protein [Halopseudomonas aestusnigri]
MAETLPPTANGCDGLLLIFKITDYNFKFCKYIHAIMSCIYIRSIDMQKSITGICIALAAVTFSFTIAHSETALTLNSLDAPEEAIRHILEKEIRPLSQLQTIVYEIKKQNKKHSGLNSDQIIALDQIWRQETEAIDQPLIRHMLGSPLSKELQTIRNNSNGLITEIIVIDNKGLNVAISDVTSDYWQGDEDKWQKTLPKGPDAVFVSDAGIDESTQQFQLQISVTVVDTERKIGVGSLTVGIDLDLLEIYLEFGAKEASLNKQAITYEK